MGLAKRSQPDLTIEPVASRNTLQPNDVYKVIEHGVYERGSVLEGLPKRSFLDSFMTLEDAVEAYPGALVLDYSTKQAGNPLPHTAPDWFDPAYGGERWDEDY